jgi:site-specific recombinase XerD
MRHTFATVMLAAGVHHRTLMELMGHSDVGTTLNIYADVVEPLKVEASRRMHLALTGS